MAKLNVSTKTVWPTKPTIHIIWPFTEEICQILVQRKKRGCTKPLGTKREVKLRVTRHRSEGEEKKLMILVWITRMWVPEEKQNLGRGSRDNEFIWGKF